MTLKKKKKDVKRISCPCCGESFDLGMADGSPLVIKGWSTVFIGRTIDEESGVVYRIYRLSREEEEGEVSTTTFIEDRLATATLSSLLDAEGNVRRTRVKK